MINEETVRHVARLARLGLSDKEVEKFSKQLSSVFEYMKILNEVDTENIEPTSQVTGLRNVSRPDEVEGIGDPDELLKCSELPVVRHQIRVKPVFK